MSKTWTSLEQLINKSWASHEQIIKRTSSEQVMIKLRLLKVLNKGWISND